MRKGYKADWILNDGVLVGVSLGADFTAEHECGIKDIRRQFDMKEDGLGIEKRQVRFVPNNLHLYYDKPKTEAALVFDSGIKHLDDAKKYCDLFYGSNDNKDLATAWDESSFGVLAKGSGVKYLEELYQAFQNEDIAIWLGKFADAGLIANAGLLLMIVSRIPQQHLDTMREADKDHIQLTKAAKATGIEKRLEAAKRGYYALSPRWMFEDRKSTSKYPVIFWLNPCEQHENNAGWFSVEELDEWIAGKGPIPIKK